MIQLDLEWKGFNLNLVAVQAAITALAPATMAGLSADTALHVVFSEETDEATGQSIKDYWDSLTEDSEEATSYVSRQVIREAILAARADAVTKDWDELSTAQRKLLAGLSPTRGDLGL